jgi:hypothetical protein
VTTNTEALSPEASPIQLLCQACKRQTQHRVAAHVRQTEETALGSGRNHVLRKDNLIVECLGCRTISFSREFFRREEGGGFRSLGRPQRFPEVPTGRPLMSDVDKLPADVARIYKETNAALSLPAPVLAGVGIRAIVEAVCQDKVGDTGNLDAKIKRLADAGLVSAKDAVLLHSLRFMGNAAAHEVKAHSERELYVAFKVIEHLLNGAYVIPSLGLHLPLS